MKVQVFNVGHGFCALVIADDGATMLVDCTHSAQTLFYPSDYLPRLGIARIDRLFVLNYDDDHVRGLPDLRRKVGVTFLHANRTISPTVLYGMKLLSGPIRPGMASMIQMLGEYSYFGTDPNPWRLTSGTPATSTALTSILRPAPTFMTFNNSYQAPFTDTNNLSMVLFLEYGGHSIAFTGDLEKAGWRELLKNPWFRDYLSRVTFFVASHHGREDGYVPEVFNICTPRIVLISDDDMQFDSQEHCYELHASGVLWSDGRTRRVLTTRADGTITITLDAMGDFRIDTTGTVKERGLLMTLFHGARYY